MQIETFINETKSVLETEYKAIPLFNFDCVKGWDKEKKHKFVSNLYHARGHFDRQLFQRTALCSTSKSDKLKKLEDICDELGIEFDGKDGIQGLLTGAKTTVRIVKSHEQLFLEFAKDVNCSIKQEVSSYKQPAYLEEYNETMVKLLTNESELIREVSFSAYELLDNIDYHKLFEIAVILGATKKGLVFFDIHRHSNHFEKTKEKLMTFWERDELACKQIFEQVFKIQSKMWTQLSININ